MSFPEIAFLAFQPSNAIALLFVLCALAAILRRWRLARVGLALGAFAYLAAGVLPLGQALLRPLEARFPVADFAEAPAGIIVLGGFGAPQVRKDHVTMALNRHADRLTEAMVLAARFPQARVIVTDGSFGAARPGDAAGRLAAALGLEPERLMVEGRATSTWENARNTFALIEPREGDTFALVTSAWHMPRAMAVFRKVGFTVAPYPVDYVDDGRPLWRGFERMASNGLQLSDLAAREWAALAYYAVRGRIDRLFPGPTERPANAARAGGRRATARATADGF